ncbi:MAG: right-handed parallel beta-helix repeat-containing protein [Prevotella sp.]|nr:right-handed parallel beta-helix repeat-containing protein [Prevotella sp.]
MTTKKVLLMLLASLVMPSVDATVRYASPAGTDANGTSKEQPGNLVTMVGKLAAGDVLYLLDGQYDLKALLKVSKSGTADNYITIAAAEGATPILDFRQEPNGTNGIQVGGNYVHIKGLTIRYAGKKGIWLEKAAYCILERLDVYGCCDSGIQLRSGGNNMVINCDSHDNFDYQADGGNADGFADKQGEACPGNIYIGCRSWNNSDDGWDSFQRVTNGTPTVYVHCITYNNGRATFDLTSHPRANGVDKNLSCMTGKDFKNFPNGGNPNGFKLGGQGSDNKSSGNYTKHNTELYRCLAVGHRAKGFDQNNNAGKMKIVNCTSYKNKINYGFGNDYPYTLEIRNSISLSPTGGTGSSNHLATSSKGTVTQSNNTWMSGFAVSEADFESLDVEKQILAERQADGSLPETLLLRLKSTATNLIDKGVAFDGFEGNEIKKHVSFAGSAPDLGCYEYQADVSGIFQIDGTAEMMSAHAPRYDLNGRRVDESYQGVVVQCGRKYVQ